MKKPYHNKKDSIDLTLLSQYGLITVLLAIWLPLPFLNFDDHHDGLILSTVRLTKTALIQGGEYPFNQYGPFWIIPFVLLSLLIPNAYLFLGVRFLTVFFYIISAFLLWKIARLFLDKKLANVVVILFLGSQPFITEYGSSLVPWPSAVVMPFILAITYFGLLQITETDVTINSSKMPIYIGLLLPPIIFSRIQVGIFLAVTSLVLMNYSKQKFKFLKIFIGFFFSSFVIVLYLFHTDWLGSALYDQIVFGFTYLLADKSTFPIPIFTFFGILLFLLTFIFGPKVLRKFQIHKFRSMLLSTLFISFLIFASIFFLIHQRSISPLAALVIFTRRFWISLGIASLLFLCVKMLRIWSMRTQGSDNFKKFPTSLLFLLLFAVSFQSQVYPLFDQMHFWWGSPLTFLIVIITLKDTFGNTNLRLVSKSSTIFLAVCLLLASILIPWTTQLSSPKKALPNQIGLNLFAAPQNSQEEIELQEFFAKNINKGAKVLNLCDDSNIFFESDRYVSASRFFIFWGEQMSHAPRIFRSFLESKPDFVLTCGLTHAPSLRFRQEIMQQLILNNFINQKAYPAEHTSENNRIWRIYRVLEKP
jgi:hypothetical protein